MVQALAYRLQEKAFGGLQKSIRRELLRLSAEFQSTGAISATATADFKPGTKLIREWRGKIHEIEVLTDGFSWSGRRYQTLSKIARSITGTRWSGPRFSVSKPLSRPPYPKSEVNIAKSSNPTARCAIYTRKSSEEGLEQAFNSLDAQREACEAYVLSQAGEGWRALAARYDDGGFSGGNMERPALQSGCWPTSTPARSSTVVVYKVDRLTRSLPTSPRSSNRSTRTGVSFVSVTQAFNTTTTMGRLTLNVLLSFAQFEREVTGERIRDKIAASKKKGMWMGGNLPLGYDLKDHKLVVSNKEAKTVKTIFQLYAELGAVRKVKAEIDRLKSSYEDSNPGIWFDQRRVTVPDRTPLYDPA